MIIKSRILPNT